MADLAAAGVHRPGNGRSSPRGPRARAPTAPARSQGVSRKLGYRSDGISRDVRDGEVVVSDRLRLDRADWDRVVHPPAEVDGLDVCRAGFGV